MNGFTIKDSGKREEYATGSRRDTEDGKPDWTLVFMFRHALLRDAAHLAKGLAKYGRHNWAKGQSMARAERSMCRHLDQYLAGDRDEDHLAALRFNAGLIMDHEARIASGELPATLDDRDERRRGVPVVRAPKEGDVVEILEALPSLPETESLVGTYATVTSSLGDSIFLTDTLDDRYDGCYALPSGVRVVG